MKTITAMMITNTIIPLSIAGVLIPVAGIVCVVSWVVVEPVVVVVVVVVVVSVVVVNPPVVVVAIVVVSVSPG